MKNWLCILAIGLAVGCTTARVRPYVGEQQAWPTGMGSIVNTKYQLPVFTTLPPTSYAVLCELRIESLLYANPEERHLPLLVNKAKQLGADAVILVNGQVFFGTTYGQAGGGTTVSPTALNQVNRFNPEFFKSGVTAVAIQWLAEPPPGLPEKFYPKSRKYPESAATATPSPTVPAKTEEPKATAPKIETPKQVAPAPEAPKVESAQGQPTVTITITKPSPVPAAKPEEPKVEPPATPAPTPEAPKTEPVKPEPAPAK